MNRPRFFLNPDFGLLLIRVGLGLMFFFQHGLPKLRGGPQFWERVGANIAHVGIDFAHPVWGFLAAISEAGGGLLLLLGLWVRPASAALLCTMFVACLSHFAKGQGLSGAAHPLELGIVFAGLIFLGAGRYSLDASWRRRQ